ncbi:RHS repeat domain-containing protein [Mucilaginibacter sp. BT774]|uniref:RHS repeat domain-containing protein n=1 Tax=Mucilaginibacter sp. BT774 TaxID=3062276 RepID=UPI0026748923|nr:RHS repeat-associated core domain-containing protein [Mucilaginibacter sp. BT774]MDO3627652.1 RHS repeat-associated core domain-containing protein [Mucilaginibacter sp. BT774]
MVWTARICVPNNKWLSCSSIIYNRSLITAGLVHCYSSSPTHEYLYNKKELQEELGEYDYGARFYDPVITRWSMIDPLVEAGQEAVTPYGYVFDNPIKNTDPDGRYPDGGPGDDNGQLDAVKIGLAFGSFVQSVKESVMKLAYNAGDAVGITPNKPGMKWEATQVLGSDGTYSTVMQEVPRGTLMQDLGGHAVDGITVAGGLSMLSKGTTGSFFAKQEPEGVTAGSAAQAAKKSFTEPTLPGRTIAKKDGGEIVHYTKSGDHGPPHLHVNGGGKGTKIGSAGKPLKGSPELTGQQQGVVDEFKSEIRSAVRKIGKWFNYQSK